MNCNEVGILGYGEIGSSLEKCYLGKEFKIFIKDLDRDDGFSDLDVLNVCIPFFNIDSFTPGKISNSLNDEGENGNPFFIKGLLSVPSRSKNIALLILLFF